MKVADFFTGSRKFTVMAVLIVVASGFRLSSLIDSKDFADLLSATGVAFMGSNAVEHIGAAVQSFLAKKMSEGAGE